jgi:hypothetical protein
MRLEFSSGCFFRSSSREFLKEAQITGRPLIVVQGQSTQQCKIISKARIQAEIVLQDPLTQKLTIVEVRP